MAGSAVTYLDNIFAQGFGTELSVEGDDAVDVGRRYAGYVTDIINRFFRNVAVSVLGGLQKRYKSTRLAVVFP